MDLPSLNALLRVNGLTNASAPENIRDVLLRSGYSADEIPEALSILKGGPPSPLIHVPGAYVEKTIHNTRIIARSKGETFLFSGRVGVLQFWMGTLLALAVYGLMFILVEVSAVPVYSLISGISLFSPPDLATASVHALLLFGIGMAMLILPALFFLVISIGLQIRRCHDFGLSGAAWFMAMVALLMGVYLVGTLTPLALLSVPAAFILWIAFMSWPGMQADNFEGSRTFYPSVWGVLSGCCDETGCLTVFVRKFILPLAYLEVFGIVLSFSIHTILPKAHLPSTTF